MNRSRTQIIKREQKKSLYFREISSLIQALAQDEPSLSKVFVTRVDLSPDNGMCTVYFGIYTDKAAFKDALGILILYKPSLRTALGKKISARHVPDLLFRFDETKEKERHLHEILDRVTEELPSLEKDAELTE